MQSKKIIILNLLLTLCVGSVVTGGCDKISTSKVEPNAITSMVDEYLHIRYQDLNAENFYERIKAQSDFYTVELQAEDSWAVNQGNIDETYKSFLEHGIEASILTYETNMISDSMCGVHLYVLFAPDNYLQAYYTEYDLLIDAENNANDYLISNISVVNKESYYVEGKEIHIQGNTVNLVEVHPSE